jgi:cyanuric acid amidohydrolase
MIIEAIKFLTRGPADISGLESAMVAGRVDPAAVICIIGKTEGNGGRNDFTRDLAMLALEQLFARRLQIPLAAVSDRIIFSFSGGCEGVVSPHFIVFQQRGQLTTERQPAARLAIASGFTREFSHTEIGHLPQVLETAQVIRQLVAQLRVDTTADVHLVQMKGAIPQYTYNQAQEAQAQGQTLRCDMVHSRAASALGAALALGEISLADLTDDSIARDWHLYSGVASCSAKPGLMRTEIMVMANSHHAQGNLQIAHGVLQDMLDVPTIWNVLEQLAIRGQRQLDVAAQSRIVGVFAKSEADPRGSIRGQRHTMLTDDDISDTRYSRCVLGAVLASVLGDTAIYVSTRAEHHGPIGGGTVAIIAQVDDSETVTNQDGAASESADLANGQ